MTSAVPSPPPRLRRSLRHVNLDIAPNLMANLTSPHHLASRPRMSESTAVTSCLFLRTSSKRWRCNYAVIAGDLDVWSLVNFV